MGAEPVNSLAQMVLESTTSQVLATAQEIFGTTGQPEEPLSMWAEQGKEGCRVSQDRWDMPQAT
jgi:hypothetical protein